MFYSLNYYEYCSTNKVYLLTNVVRNCNVECWLLHFFSFSCDAREESPENWLYLKCIHLFMLPMLQKNKDPRVLYAPYSNTLRVIFWVTEFSESLFSCQRNWKACHLQFPWASAAVSSQGFTSTHGSLEGPPFGFTQGSQPTQELFYLKAHCAIWNLNSGKQGMLGGNSYRTENYCMYYKWHLIVLADRTVISVCKCNKIR